MPKVLNLKDFTLTAKDDIQKTFDNLQPPLKGKWTIEDLKLQAYQEYLYIGDEILDLL